MSTLGAMKADIARDLGNSNLALEIADAINRAIKFYQGYLFWFNESRTYTFSTVVGQVYYGSSDDSDIPLIRSLEGIILERTDGQDYPLRKMGVQELEILTDPSSSSGEPYAYSYYANEIGVCDKPDAVYNLRMFGNFAAAAPGADDEPNNPWMLNAYNLIRSRASYDLAFYKLRNYTLAEVHLKAANGELQNILDETVRRLRRGTVKAMSF